MSKNSTLEIVVGILAIGAIAWSAAHIAHAVKGYTHPRNAASPQGTTSANTAMPTVTTITPWTPGGQIQRAQAAARELFNEWW